MPHTESKESKRLRLLAEERIEEERQVDEASCSLHEMSEQLEPDDA